MLSMVRHLCTGGDVGVLLSLDYVLKEGVYEHKRTKIGRPEIWTVLFVDRGRLRNRRDTALEENCVNAVAIFRSVSPPPDPPPPSPGGIQIEFQISGGLPCPRPPATPLPQVGRGGSGGWQLPRNLKFNLNAPGWLWGWVGG